MKKCDALRTKVAVEAITDPDGPLGVPVLWYEATVRADQGAGAELFRSVRSRSRAYARKQAEAFRQRLIAEAEDN